MTDSPSSSGPGLFVGESFDEVRRPQTGVVLAGSRYERCAWRAFDVGALRDAPLDRWPRIEDVHFIRCKCLNGWLLLRSVLRDVVWDSARGNLRVVASAMEHVRIEGRSGMVEVDFVPSAPMHRHAIQQAADFHRSVDWCLDISEAEPKDWRISVSDPSKVKIDASRQAFVSHQSLSPGRPALERITRDGGGIAWRLGRALRRDSEIIYFLMAAHSGERAERDRQLIEQIHREGWALPTYQGATDVDGGP